MLEFTLKDSLLKENRDRLSFVIWRHEVGELLTTLVCPNL